MAGPGPVTGAGLLEAVHLCRQVFIAGRLRRAPETRIPHAHTLVYFGGARLCRLRSGRRPTSELATERGRADMK
jgi:hypothetical protein